MTSDGIRKWLRARRRNAFLISAGYFLFTIAAGALVPVPVFFALYHIGGEALCIAGFIVLILVYADCLHAQRDDMSFIPRWLIREVLHAIPRLTLDGARHLVRAARLMRMDANSCADVLAFLVNRRVSASREELLKAFPDLNWERLLNELRAIDGILFLRRDSSRLGLTSTLRLELELIWMRSPRIRVEIPKRESEPEPEPNPVEEPEALSANEILGVPEGASLAEIKAAYRSRVKECHPDRFAGLDERSRERAEEWTKALNAAYETLVAQNCTR